MKTGRKSLKDELQIKQRYADLSAPYFKVLKEALMKGEKADQKWAVEQLTKAYTKMIPQEVTGEGGGPVQMQWLSQSPTSQDTGQKPSTPRVSAG